METYFPFTSQTPFVREVTARLAEDSIFAQTPDAGQVCGLINTMFWASMQSEEGHLIRASVALVSPDDPPSHNVFRLSNPVELTPHSIAKLSASFPFRPGAIAITFSPQDHPLIWGFILPKPRYGWQVEILGPGHVVVRDDFSIQAVLLPNGEIYRFVEMTSPEAEWDRLLFFFCTPFSYRNRSKPGFEFYRWLLELSRAMVEHRRGGTMVVVNPTDTSWSRHIDLTYKFSKPEEHLSTLSSELSTWWDKLYRAHDRKRKAKGDKLHEIFHPPDSDLEWRLRRALRLAGGLTAVDGAMVITTDLKILGYGAKLKAPAKQIKVREWLPNSGYASEPIRVEHFYGTRHQSAARFVFRHPEIAVFVASQDGRFTIFCCDEAGDEVLAHRAELLLLGQKLEEQYEVKVPT